MWGENRGRRRSAACRPVPRRTVADRCVDSPSVSLITNIPTCSSERCCEPGVPLGFERETRDKRLLWIRFSGIRRPPLCCRSPTHGNHARWGPFFGIGQLVEMQGREDFLFESASLSPPFFQRSSLIAWIWSAGHAFCGDRPVLPHPRCRSCYRSRYSRSGKHDRSGRSCSSRRSNSPR